MGSTIVRTKVENMIRHISFRNYKALRSVDVALERFSVFVGSNASGKSSILQGIDYLCKLSDRHLLTSQYLSYLRPKYSRGGNGEQQLQMFSDQGGLRVRLSF